MLSNHATSIIKSYGFNLEDHPAHLLQLMKGALEDLMNQADKLNEGPKTPQVMDMILSNMRAIGTAITELKAIVDRDTKAFNNSYAEAKEIYRELCK